MTVKLTVILPVNLWDCTSIIQIACATCGCPAALNMLCVLVH